MKELLFKTKVFCKRNGSTILTCAGALGVVATAVTAVKATPKALQLLDEAAEEKQEDLTRMEKIKIAGPVYVPSILMGAGTVTCIFGANMLSKRQQASLISAYTLLDKSYKEYKDKVKELYGEDSDKHIRAEVAQDNYDLYEDEETEDEYEDEFEDGKLLYYDQFSNRYFRSTLADVLNAEHNINKILYTQGGAYLNDFYELLGIEKIPSGNELGWSVGILESMYWAQWIEFDHEKVAMDDGMECYIITMRYEPVIDFAYY